MNARTPALVAAVLLTTQPALADEAYVVRPAPEPKNALVVNAGSLINGGISVEYERALSDDVGLNLGMSAVMFRSAWPYSGTTTFTAVGPSVGARFHFIESAPAGLWLGPEFDAVYIAARSDGSVVRAWGYGLGASVGYNLALGHLLLQAGAGGGLADYGDGILWTPHVRLGIGGIF